MMESSSKLLFEKAWKVLHRVEDTFLVALLALMMGLIVAKVLSRNLFDVGFIWGDVLVRILVLWIGLVGAMIATREGKHISIDLVTRYLPQRMQTLVNATIALVVSTATGLAGYYSLQFVLYDFQAGSIAFGRVPAWVCEAIIPLALLIISIRYFLILLASTLKISKTTP